MRIVSLSRSAHSTDSSMFALLMCYTEDAEHTHPKKIFQFVISHHFLFLVLFHRIREKKRTRRIRKKEKLTKIAATMKMTTAMRTLFSELPTNNRSSSDTSSNDNDTTSVSIDLRGSKGRQR